MFERPGQKIQSFAQIFAVIQLIAGFIAGIVIATEAESFLLFLLIFIGTAISAVLSGLFLYGFGTLIESSEANEQNTREILAILRRQPGGASAPAPKAAPAAPTAPKAVSAVPSAPAASPAPAAAAPAQKAPAQKAAPGDKEPVVPIPLEDGREKCPYCLCIQRAGRNLCMDCGSPFLRD